MRLFFSRDDDRTLPVTAFLRHMEEGRLEFALKALKRHAEPPDPPPHALWRLARGLAESGKPKAALVPLRLFVDLYPGHGDRPAVLRDLALALSRCGRAAEAAEVAQRAEASRRGVAVSS